MNLQNIFFDGIENSEQWLISVRRELHEHPELDFDLPETTGIICRYLDEIGIPYKTGIGKSGIVADLTGKNSNITIALRADIDALPILESTGCEYSSKNTGKMHACGHDVHTSILLGTAKILADKKEELPCNVRFIFQPAEETTGGAVPMIEDGVLEGVNCIFGTMQSGTKENIVAQEAFCCGTMRSLSNSVRDKAKKRVNTIVEMVSAAERFSIATVTMLLSTTMSMLIWLNLMAKIFLE